MDKNQRKKIFQELAQKQEEKLIAEMPISGDAFKKLIEELECQLDDYPCDHSLTLTEKLLRNHPQKEAIIQWFQNHGGYCDCEVLLNVTEAYQCILEEDKPQESPLNQISTEKLNRFITTAGLAMDPIPKPWTVFACSNAEEKWHQFYFGKKSLWSLNIAFFEKPIPLDSDESFIAQWEEISSLKGDFHVQRDSILLGQHLVERVVVKTLQWSPVIIWIFDRQNPAWFFLAKTETPRLASDLIELQNFLKKFSYTKT